jgi:RNA polymerase sigma-70 factor (ECF subfamily)
MKLKKSMQPFTGSNVSHNELSDEELMEQFIAGNTLAFEKIYHRYKSPVYNFSIRYVKKTSVAEEITHDCFIKIHQNKHNYKLKHSFKAWMWTIVRNTCIDFTRKKNLISLSSEIGNEDSTPIEETLVDHSQDIELSLIEKATRKRLDHCLTELTENQMKVMHLKIFSGMSLKEMQDVLDLKISTIKSHVLRAKQSLKKCLSKEECDE